MKRIYLISAALIAGGVMMSGGTKAKLSERAVFRTGHTQAKVQTADTKGGKSLRATLRNDNAAALWCAGKVSVYEPGAEPGEWEKSAEYTSTYNSQGKFVKEIMQDLMEDPESEYAWTVTTRDYNEAGNYILEKVQTGASVDDLTNSSMVERAYDERIPSLLVENYRYQWQNDDWSIMAGVSYKRDVTRDSKGNVTQVLYKSLYQGEYTPVQRVDIEYGSDGKASSLTEYQLQYDEQSNEYWQEGFSLKECEWYVTDGQLFDLDYVFEGSNKIKSCTQYHGGELVGTMAVTYVGDTDDFLSVLTSDDGSQVSQKWTDLPYGGFDNVITFKYPLEEGETEPYTEQEIIREEYDMLGNMTHSSDVLYAGDYAEVYAWSQAESEVNADGVPVSLIMRDFYPAMEEEEYGLRVAHRAEEAADEPPVAGEWEDVSKFEFSDLINVAASIDEIASAPSSEGAVEYFTIDGRRVSSPAAGLYIRRAGAKAEKVIIR